MTPLRQQMHDAMLVRGLAERTRQAYIKSVARLAIYYDENPANLAPEQVEAWLLHLIRDRKLSYSTLNQAASACRFFYGTVLNRERSVFLVPMDQTPQRQPEILARAELVALFARAATLQSRTLLQTAYATGLRVSEVCALRINDIDSHPDRMCLRVRHGKGGKDRYTLLSPTLLEALRYYWCAYHPKEWLFPGRNGSDPITYAGAHFHYHQARSAAKISKSGGIHTHYVTVSQPICWKPVLIWPRFRSCSAIIICPPPAVISISCLAYGGLLLPRIPSICSQHCPSSNNPRPCPSLLRQDSGLVWRRCFKPSEPSILMHTA